MLDCNEKADGRQLLNPKLSDIILFLKSFIFSRKYHNHTVLYLIALKTNFRALIFILLVTQNILYLSQAKRETERQGECKVQTHRVRDKEERGRFKMCMYNFILQRILRTNICTYDKRFRLTYKCMYDLCVEVFFAVEGMLERVYRDVSSETWKLSHNFTFTIPKIHVFRTELPVACRFYL